MGAQRAEGPTFPAIHAAVPQAVDHRQLQVAHSATDIECEKGANAAQRHDVHSRQTPDYFVVDDDQVLPIGDGHELHVGRQSDLATTGRSGPMFEQRHDRPPEIAVDPPQRLDDVFREGSARRHGWAARISTDGRAG